MQGTSIYHGVRSCHWNLCVLSYRMRSYITYAVFLLLAVGIYDLAFANDDLLDLCAKKIETAVTPTEFEKRDEQAARPLTPNAVETRREIVIDKRGRRIGLAIPNRQGGTNNGLLRLRSGKRFGNQIFDPNGRRVGIIISR
jgi:hypothetical protein